MSVTGIFFIPDTELSKPLDLALLQDRLLKLPDSNSIKLPPWSLQHWLYRYVMSDQANPRNQHVLTLSHHGGKGYAYITGANVITGSGNQINNLNHLLNTKLSLLWPARPTLHIANAPAYEVEPGLTVRLGNVMQIGQPAQLRGLICCIQATKAEAAPSDNVKADEDDKGGLLTRVKELWAKVGAQNAKEYYSTSNEGMSDAHAEAKAWCDALRLRG